MGKQSNFQTLTKGKIMYKIIENKERKTYYIVNTSTGECVADTENKESAKRILANLTDHFKFTEYEKLRNK